MNIKNVKTRLLLFLSIAIFAQSCSNDPKPELPAGSAGYFVVNEGGFGNSNTSLSFFDRAKNEMTNDIFAKKNGRPLGDQAQSITVFEGKAYVVVEHSAKVEVINADDFSSITTITEDIASPRYFIGINSSKGYLSDWGADGVTGSVKVIDLGTMKVTKSIATGKGPNKMLMKDGKVYVANSGGFDNDNTVSVIDTSTDEISLTIAAGDNPNSLQFDKDGNLWIASAGKFVYNDDFTIDEVNSTPSSIMKWTGGANPVNFFLDGIFYPGVAHLSINKGGDKLFYLFNGAVYSITTGATAAPANPLIGDKYFYGLAVDPFDDDIIACEAPDFSSPGKVYNYSEAGQVGTSFTVGIAPNGVGFK
jgi:YVTN family beta-propeller protein